MGQRKQSQILCGLPSRYLPSWACSLVLLLLEKFSCVWSFQNKCELAHVHLRMYGVWQPKARCKGSVVVLPGGLKEVQSNCPLGHTHLLGLYLGTLGSGQCLWYAHLQANSVGCSALLASMMSLLASMNYGASNQPLGFTSACIEQWLASLGPTCAGHMWGLWHWWGTLSVAHICTC